MCPTVVRAVAFCIVAVVILIYFVSFKWWGAHCRDMASQKNIVCSEKGSQVLSFDEMWEAGKGTASEQNQSHGPCLRCFLVLIGYCGRFTEVERTSRPNSGLVLKLMMPHAHQGDSKSRITHIMRFPRVGKTDFPAGLKRAGESWKGQLA